MAAGRFREDLFFRLNTVELHLPPLRERRDDIPLLAKHFLDRFSTHYRRPVREFAPEAMQALLRYAWPGNVRELAHAIERATLLAQGEVVQPGDLALQPSTAAAPSLEDMSLEDVERVLISKAMARYEGNVSQAANALGLSRSALYRRLQRHGL